MSLTDAGYTRAGAVLTVVAIVVFGGLIVWWVLDAIHGIHEDDQAHARCRARGGIVIEEHHTSAWFCLPPAYVPAPKETSP